MTTTPRIPRSPFVYEKNGRFVKLIGSTHIHIQLKNNAIIVPAKDLAMTRKTKTLFIWHTTSSVSPTEREVETADLLELEEIFNALIEAMTIQLQRQEEKENCKHLILHSGDKEDAKLDD